MRWCVQGSKSDESLVLMAQNGDPSATEQLLRRYAGMVRALARRFFLAGGETDDLVQEGMIGLVSAVRKYRAEEGKSFKNFAYLCVRRHILDAVKASARRKNGPLNQSLSLSDPTLGNRAEEGSPEDLILESEEEREFRKRLLKELSDFEFRVVTMYLDGMSYAEICEATGRNGKSIDNALARAKKKLQASYSFKQ